MVKTVMLVLFISMLAIPRTAYAGIDNGNGNDGQNNGNGNGDNNGHYGEGNNGNGNGNGGSVPVNGGLAFLAIAGVAYSAKKFYDLKYKPAAA